MRTSGDRLKGVIHFKRQKGFFLTHSLSAQVLFYYFAHGQRGPRVTRLRLNETTVSSKHDDKSQVLSVTCGLFVFCFFCTAVVFTASGPCAQETRLPSLALPRPSNGPFLAPGGAGGGFSGHSSGGPSGVGRRTFLVTAPSGVKMLDAAAAALRRGRGGERQGPS